MSNPLIALVAVALGLTQGTLMFDAPDGWRALTPTSSMRVAEFELLRADGDPEDASLIVYYFGGSGGSVEANLERWLGQMVQPDDRPSRDVATTRMFEAGGLPITHLAVGGTYVAESPARRARSLREAGVQARSRGRRDAERAVFREAGRAGPHDRSVECERDVVSGERSVRVGYCGWLPAPASSPSR